MAYYQSKQSGLQDDRKNKEPSRYDKLNFLLALEKERLEKERIPFFPDFDILDLRYQLLKLAKEEGVPDYIADLITRHIYPNDKLLTGLIHLIVINFLINIIPDNPEVTPKYISNILQDILGRYDIFKNKAYKENFEPDGSSRHDEYLSIVRDYWSNLNPEAEDYLAFIFYKLYADIGLIQGKSNSEASLEQLFLSLGEEDPGRLIDTSNFAQILLYYLYNSIKSKNQAKEILSPLIPPELVQLAGEYSSKY